MLTRTRVAVSILALLGFAAFANAAPLRMDYEVTDLGGGLYDYEFLLYVDNNDGSYSPGQGWRWIIFGDSPAPGPSPLTAFIIDPSSLPVGPYTSVGSSGGGHNGPVFSYVLDYWIPSGVGDGLAWSGTSTANLAQGELLFSTLAGTLNGGVAANFEAANLIVPQAIPEPASLLLVGLGAGLICAVRRRRRKV